MQWDLNFLSPWQILCKAFFFFLSSALVLYLPTSSSRCLFVESYLFTISTVYYVHVITPSLVVAKLQWQYQALHVGKKAVSSDFSPPTQLLLYSSPTIVLSVPSVQLLFFEHIYIIYIYVLYIYIYSHSCTHTFKKTHTHTHTHIYVYVYMLMVFNAEKSDFIFVISTLSEPCISECPRINGDELKLCWSP